MQIPLHLFFYVFRNSKNVIFCCLRLIRLWLEWWTVCSVTHDWQGQFLSVCPGWRLLHRLSCRPVRDQLHLLLLLPQRDLLLTHRRLLHLQRRFGFGPEILHYTLRDHWFQMICGFQEVSLMHVVLDNKTMQKYAIRSTSPVSKIKKSAASFALSPSQLWEMPNTLVSASCCRMSKLKLSFSNIFRPNK